MTLFNADIMETVSAVKNIPVTIENHEIQKPWFSATDVHEYRDFCQMQRFCRDFPCFAILRQYSPECLIFIEYKLQFILRFQYTQKSLNTNLQFYISLDNGCMCLFRDILMTSQSLVLRCGGRVPMLSAVGKRCKRCCRLHVNTRSNA